MSDRAYRGYMIRHNPISDVWWVERDGHRVAYCTSVDDGKRIIDEILD